MLVGESRHRILAEARSALGIEELVLVIHDASFPSREDEDTGRGSPYSRGARDLLAWAKQQGFTGIQFGPQGETSAQNPSPYDGTVFAKTILSAAFWPLAHDPAWEGILSPRTLDAIVAGAPPDGRRVDYPYVYQAHRRAMREAWAHADREGDLWERFRRFRQKQAWWLERDARLEALSVAYGTDDWRAWPADHRGARAPDAEEELFAFGQFVVHAQHDELLRHANDQALRLFGDLHVGFSFRDGYDRSSLFLADYVMGAPPSRTNADGQPWGYPVLDPRSTEGLALFRARVEKMLSEFHGLRVDHPHGLVCPWVYARQHTDAVRAVNEGARLFESPDLPDHPELAAFAIARNEQIQREVARYADGWVTELDEAQVDQYCRQFQVLMDAARAQGRDTKDILCEVLSTCPHPLHRVLKRYGLGRFRVTQKADPRDENDTYRSDRATFGDWIMLGNHDTSPIWRAVATWPGRGLVTPWCDYLERRLGAGSVDREAIGRDPMHLAHLMFADLFAGEAGHVSVFFPDLMGSSVLYNVPGLISDDNWSERIGNDFASVYNARSAEGRALSVPRALATALRAKGRDELATRLDAL
jgi:4-alpha-glucanotransferase